MVTLLIFGGKYLVIHVQVPSWHPQQHICHIRKSKPSLYDSLTNILRFIKGGHPHQTTGSKVPEFRGKNSPFCPPCSFTYLQRLTNNLFNSLGNFDETQFICIVWIFAYPFRNYLEIFLKIFWWNFINFS
jgi:hypothetical protein